MTEIGQGRIEGQLEVINRQFREVYNQYLDMVRRRKTFICIAIDRGLSVRRISQLLDCPVNTIAATLKKAGYVWNPEANAWEFPMPDNKKE